MPTMQKIQKYIFFNGKVVLLMFYDLSGLVLSHCQKYGKSFNLEKYYVMLGEKCKSAVCRKPNGLLSRGVVLQ